MTNRLTIWLLALCIPLLTAAKTHNVRFTYSELTEYRDELMPLLDVIASGEGEYYSVNRGRAGDSKGDWAKEHLGQSITEMTLTELRTHQGGKRPECWYEKTKGEANLFAVGRYQLIPCTLQYATQEIEELDMNSHYEPKVQDTLGIFLLLVKRPVVRDYLAGIHNNHQKAGQELAKEFASIPIQYANTRCKRGQSYYCGDKAGNKAHISLSEIDSALRIARKKVMNDGKLHQHITGTKHRTKRRRFWWKATPKRSLSVLESLEHTLFDFVFPPIPDQPEPEQNTLPVLSTPIEPSQEIEVQPENYDNDVINPRIVPNDPDTLDKE